MWVTSVSPCMWETTEEQDKVSDHRLNSRLWALLDNRRIWIQRRRPHIGYHCSWWLSWSVKSWRDIQIGGTYDRDNAIDLWYLSKDPPHRYCTLRLSRSRSCSKWTHPIHCPLWQRFALSRLIMQWNRRECSRSTYDLKHCYHRNWRCHPQWSTLPQPSHMFLTVRRGGYPVHSCHFHIAADGTGRVYRSPEAWHYKTIPSGATTSKYEHSKIFKLHPDSARLPRPLVTCNW